MKLLYSGTTRLSFDDTDRGGIRVVFFPGDELILRDEDIEKSPSLQRALTDGVLVKTGNEEPGTGTAWEDTSGGALASSHSHSNKAELDLFITGDKSALDGAVADQHTHANKTVLDNTQESFTTALKSSYDGAVTDKHTHANKTVLDNTQESFTTALKSQYDAAEANVQADWNESNSAEDSFIQNKPSIPSLLDMAGSPQGVSIMSGAMIAGAGGPQPPIVLTGVSVVHSFIMASGSTTGGVVTATIIVGNSITTAVAAADTYYWIAVVS